MMNSLQVRPTPVAFPTFKKGEWACFDRHSLLYEEMIYLSEYIQNENPDNSVLLINPNRVASQLEQWRRCLPRVVPHYAVKCNNQVEIISKLAGLGTGFDCASKSEMELVLSCGVSPSRIIYSNPVKNPTGLKYANFCNVNLTVFDNLDEIAKISSLHPGTQLLLRIKTDDSTSQCPLSCKFGASSASWLSLLTAAKECGLMVCGVHFHVGSGCSESGAFTKAIEDSKSVFDLGTQLGFVMNILNIGGGFPGASSDNAAFEMMAEEINCSLDLHFSDPSVIVMSEPGRFFASAACTLATKVYGRRKAEAGSSDHAMYYINDGVYGCFNNLLFDHASVHPRLLLGHSPPLVALQSLEELDLDLCLRSAQWESLGHDNPMSSISLQLSSFFGQTCDGLDCVAQNVMFPELSIGDWLVFESMGAYTISAASNFNGFDLPLRIHYPFAPNCFTVDLALAEINSDENVLIQQEALRCR